MTPDTLAHIRADVQTAMIENRNDDSALLPDLVAYLLTELGKVALEARPVVGFCPACSGDYAVALWAWALLERVQLRATSQIPFGEPPTPPDDTDWSDIG